MSALPGRCLGSAVGEAPQRLRSTTIGRRSWPRFAAGLTTRMLGKRRTAVAYVQLVYGRQLQQPADEEPADPLDVASMNGEQRDALKRRILAQHPHLVETLRGEDIGEPEA
jgi:hypothetical protein